MHGYARSFDAIGVTNTVVVDSEDALDVALEIARAEVDALDRACSRFRDDSELAAVNRAAGVDTPAGPLLLGVVEAALRVSAATHGLVDPTVGQALCALGYDRDFRVVAGSGPGAVRFVAATGWRRVRIDRRRGTIRLPRGAQLDLGAVAKAFSADRSASGSSVPPWPGGCSPPSSRRQRARRRATDSPPRGRSGDSQATHSVARHCSGREREHERRRREDPRRRRRGLDRRRGRYGAPLRGVRGGGGVDGP
jgi:hypothetical protein